MVQQKMFNEKKEKDASPDRGLDREKEKEPRRFPMRPPAKSRSISPTPPSELKRQFSNEVNFDKFGIKLFNTKFTIGDIRYLKMVLNYKLLTVSGIVFQ